jgi:hypothetical protein
MNMIKSRLRDIVILLPGITGSVLQKNGVDLWAISGKSISKAIISLGDSLQELEIINDDPKLDDLGDGIQATSLMPDAHIVPGLVKIDGYSSVTKLIKERFMVVQGTPDGGQPANYFEFPYDWRRDNRVAARKLRQLIEKHLPKWREFSGAQDAKVILLAHSMGGLVSRYYLECLEGWRDCRALVTFGTPYRGSVDALGFLANGYKKALVDLTRVLQSCTSVYQLLPIYQMLEVDGEWQRIAEVEKPITGVNAVNVKAALAFHREIEAGVAKRVQQGGHYPLIPFVGICQKTLQSAHLSGDKIKVTENVPKWIDSRLEDGDGRVPRLSAIPLELSKAYLETFISGRHASLQRHEQVLGNLHQRITQMQVKGLSAICGPQEKPELEKRPALSLDIEDMYVAGEPVKINARILLAEEAIGGVYASIFPVDPQGEVCRHQFVETVEGWTLDLGDLKSGLYRVQVNTQNVGDQKPVLLEDLFEVAD